MRSPATIAPTCASRCAAEPASRSKAPHSTTVGEVGFERERTAEGLHHDQGLDGAAAEAAVALGEGQAEQSHLGIARPQRAAVAAGLVAAGEALFEAAAFGQQPLQAVLQHALLVGEVEVHVGQSPSTVLARMLRWISFEPPTIDTCRAQ